MLKPAAVGLLIASAWPLAAQPASGPACPTSVPLAPVSPSALRSTGVSVGVIDSAALGPAMGRTLSEALTARLPGVSVMRSSGVAGAGSRIRLRGPSGILAPQQPLLYIDGIRAESELQSIGTDIGGQAPSRFDDVPVEDVQCIYVLRGPAAAARYGTDASGGAIHIITRGARADTARVRAFLEAGASTDAGDYPANYGTSPLTPGGPEGSCSRARAALGQCSPGALRSWSPLDADSSFRVAPLLHAGGRLSLLTSPRLSAVVNGVGTFADGVMRINDQRRYSLGTSASYHPTSSLDVRADAWYFGGHTELPLVGNPSISILNSALLGSSVDDPVRRGYRNLPRSVLEEFGVAQRLRRLGGAARVAWTPLGWLAVNAVLGREDSRVRDARDEPLVRLMDGGFVIDPARGIERADTRGQRTSALAAATASYGPPSFHLTTNIGAQYLTETRRFESRAFTTGSAGSSEERWGGTDGETRGLLAWQEIASADRRFLEVGVRRDVLDRGFVAFENPTYPFANAAWDIGAEPFFPQGVVSALRLRAAYGESGDSRPYDVALGIGAFPAVPIGTPMPDDAARVERTTESEGGVDVGLLGGRATVEATYFTRRTKDALMPVPTPPGSGGFQPAVAPTASWRTRGLELALRTRLVDRQAVRAELAASYTSLHNEVLDLGGAAPLIGTRARVVPGFRLHGVWANPFRFADANGDGVIVPAEVTADPAPQYIGSPVPTRELGVAPSLRLGRALTIAALVDYRGGFTQINGAERLRCNARCEALYDPTASLADQARAVDPVDAAGGYLEDGDFVRLRELSVAWTFASPRHFLGAKSATLTAAARNVATWTRYSGLDPEGTLTGQGGFEQHDFFTLPLPRTFSVRLDTRW